MTTRCDSILEDIAYQIKARRMCLGMNKSQLARQSNLSWPTINAIENGEKPDVTLGTLAAIADALELDLDVDLL